MILLTTSVEIMKTEYPLGNEINPHKFPQKRPGVLLVQLEEEMNIYLTRNYPALTFTKIIKNTFRTKSTQHARNSTQCTFVRMKGIL